MKLNLLNMKLFVTSICFLSCLFYTNLCETKMTKAELLNGKININCDYLKNQQLVSFKIKVPKRPTLIVYGDSLYSEARTYVKSLKKGEIITIFDIETKTETKTEKSPTVLVTITD